MSDEAPEILKTIYVCPGLPWCSLVGDEAIDEQRAGCVWCRRETYWSDGDVTVAGPVWDMPGDDDEHEIEIEHVVQTPGGGFAVETPEIYQSEPDRMMPIVTENPESPWTLMKWRVAHMMLEWAVKMMPGGRAKRTLIGSLLDYHRQNREG